MDSVLDAIVIGGGLSGLTCARRLTEAGLACRLLEASESVGGRARTDQVDGFLLDRGFQVFLTAYPEARAILRYDELELQSFEPGALIRFAEKFHRFADPWRRPRHLIATALSPVASLRDKLKIASFRKHATRGMLDDIYQRPEQTSIEMLRSRGFSEVIVERFFRPFLGGIFLDRDLTTSSRMCEFVFRMFSLGEATLPARGMGEIARQLASQLASDVVSLESPVGTLDRQTVGLLSGEKLTARAVVLATEAPIASKLLGEDWAAEGQSVTTLYFAADEAPIQEPTLVLNGDGEGPINNMCVPSLVASNYAPPGKSLISLTCLGNEPDEQLLQGKVRSQLRDWFGTSVDGWQHLRSYIIPYALPNQFPPALKVVEKPSRLREGLYVCGDYRDTASINGAIASGRRAAEAVLADLREN